MLMEEFEKLTGFFPTVDHYAAIEAAYTDFDGDKAAFCAAWKTNKDGIADAIARKANGARLSSERKASAEFSRLNQEIARRDHEIARLKEALKREQEWKPYEDSHNISQSDYEDLANCSHTRRMSDDEAKDLLYDWFGFAREKIKIHHSVPLYEIDRHQQLHPVGEVERLPLYNSTDWNYIRFDCGRVAYELHNDQIQLFYC